MTDCGCLSHNGFLTDRGHAEVAQRSLEGLELAATDLSRYVDRVGSVSALVEGEGFHVFDDRLLDNQYRRFLDGF